VEGMPTISQGHNFNNASMIKPVVELQGACVEFLKVQAKPQSTKDGSEPLFSLKLGLR